MSRFVLESTVVRSINIKSHQRISVFFDKYVTSNDPIQLENAKVSSNSGISAWKPMLPQSNLNNRKLEIHWIQKYIVSQKH